MPSLASVIECLREAKKENALLKEQMYNFQQRASLVLIKQEMITDNLMSIIEQYVDTLPECPKMSFPEFNESD